MSAESHATETTRLSPRLREAPWAALPIKVVKWLFAGVMAAWSVLLLAWLTLHWAILPHIAQWRPQIEQRAAKALGVPLRIGHIIVRSSGWVPAIELQDVALLDARGQPALKLPRVVAALSARSLLALQPRFEQLLIDGAELDIRRDARGRILVAGLDFSGPAKDDRAAANWFFQQHEFVVRGGALRWIDDLRGAAPLALTDVQLVVRNTLRGHQIRIDATPPAAWGERFSLRGDFTQALLAERGDWRRWSGRAYASLPRADLSELRQHVTLPFDLRQGDGALRAWVELREGLPQSATVDMALRAVSLRLDEAGSAAPLAPLEFQQVQGRLAGTLADDGGSVGATGFGFLTADGIAWPRSDLSLRWQRRAGDAAASGGEFKAERLDLALMSQVATRLPLGAPLRELLAELRPEGVMSGVMARWRGPLDAPDGYELQAKIDGLSLTARPAEAGGVGRPGLRNASVQLAATDKGGSATLVIANGALDLPGVFAEPVVPLARWSSALDWRVEPVLSKGGAAGPPKLSLTVKDARFANDDAAGDLHARWSTGSGGGNGSSRLPGLLELDGKLTQGDATRVARYLPLGIPADTRTYVDRAVRSGRLDNVRFKVRGDLAEFPFGSARSAKDGVFNIAGHVDNATFAFVPDIPASGAAAPVPSPWPPLTKMSGELIFDRASMEIRNAQALLGGVALKGVKGGIATLGERPVLTLEGGGRGVLNEMLGFVNSTPIGGWTGKALAQLSGSGSADLTIALNIPLSDVAAATVKGSVTLLGNDIRPQPGLMPLVAANGKIEFSDKGFAFPKVQARVLGGESTFDGKTLPDGSLRFGARGRVSADALRRAGEGGALARLAGALSGQADYNATLAVRRGRPEVTLTSNLVGLAIDLPSPLRKAADAPLALRYQTVLAPEAVALNGAAAPLAARDTLRFELGTLLRTVYQRDLSGDAPRVLRGAVGVLELPPPMPPAGVAALLTLGNVNLDAWDQAAARLLGNSAAPAPAANASPLGEYGPTTIGLRAQELTMNGKRLSNVVSASSLDDGVWRNNLESAQIGGYIEYRAPRRGGLGPPANAGGVKAQLTHLSLPKGEADEADPLFEASPNAATVSVPSLDVTIDDLELRGKRLGRVEINAVNQQADGVREWRLRSLSITTPEARLSASGNWAAVGAMAPGGPVGNRRRAAMSFTLDLNDSGALLERLGMGRAVRGGKGWLSGQVAWLGSPFSIDYPSLTGRLNIGLDAGQFLKAEPGAARLLGVLSLQALPRRLLLDFRDVFQQGFAFDSITGDLTIAEGVAQTKHLRMRGVQATVIMEGSADLKRETQDLRVAIVPEVNAGTASLAYAAINPALGLGTFLAQLVLRRPLQAAGTREFHVTGPWGDPKVDKVERKLGDAVPDTDAPLPAPPAEALR